MVSCECVPQIYSPVPPTDGSCTPSDYNTPPPQPLPPPPTTSTSTATTMPTRPEAWDPSVQGEREIERNREIERDRREIKRDRREIERDRREIERDRER